MANFMIRFLLCNVLISGIIGILLIAKWVFRNNLSSRMQYNLWLLLLGLLAVPFMPFRLVSFPQIFSWLSSVQNSTTSHADVGTNNVMNTDLSGTTNWMNDFALSVNHDTSSVEYLDCGNACDDDIGNQIFSSFTHYKEICTSPSESESSQTV